MDVSELKKIAEDIIDQNLPLLKSISLQIHARPELAYKEFFAHDLLVDFLISKGFQVEQHYLGLETSFRAVYGNSGPIIAVLSEYDALPEIKHACGHNLIAVSGLCAGIGLKAVIEKIGYGTVVVLGTPAEEEGGGKVDLINRGAFKNIDVALMIHPALHTCVFPVVLAMQELKISYHGQNAHASAHPWEGINALDAAVTAYTSLSHLRQQIKPTDRIHGIITNGGVKPNIIPSLSSLYYYVRSKNSTDLESLKERVFNCFQAAALSTGCKMEHEWIGNPYFDVVSNPILAEIYMRNMETFGEVFLSRAEQEKQVTGSTDMGNVSYVVPSIHAWYRIEAQGGNHTIQFEAASATDKAHLETWKASKGMTFTAIELLHNPELLKKAKEHFLSVHIAK